MFSLLLSILTNSLNGLMSSLGIVSFGIRPSGYYDEVCGSQEFLGLTKEARVITVLKRGTILRPYKL